MFVHCNLPFPLDLRLEPELKELLDVSPEASNLAGHEGRDPTQLLLVSALRSLNGLKK
jgi:hypothetical protein